MRLQDTNERFAVSLAEARLERAIEERDRYLRLETCRARPFRQSPNWRYSFHKAPCRSGA